MPTDTARDTANARTQFELGAQHEAEGRTPEAISAYRQAVELDGTPDQVFRLAFLLDLHGEDEEAFGLYEQLCRLPQPPVNALINLAVIFEDRSETGHAERCLQKVLDGDATHGRARLFFKDAAGSRDMLFDEDEAAADARQNAMLDTPVTDFELSVRARNCLKKMEIRTLGDLLKVTEHELMAYKNFGETSLTEIKQMLTARGLRLGQGLEGGGYMFKRPERYAELREIAGDEILSSPVATLELSVRARKALQLLNVQTVGDLASVTEAELMGVKNFGATSLEEIRARLADRNLSLRKMD